MAGRTLVAVNSPPDRPEELAAVLERLDRAAASDVHVIAPLPWRAWLDARGWPADRVLFAADSAGRPIELNFFLEQLDALHWIVAREFAVVVCTAPHSLYNDEIKDTLERRVALFLGAGRFVTHTLPQPYVYVLELADLLRRLDRDRRSAAYAATAGALMADLHAKWIAAGRPERADPATPPVDAVLAKHLGPLMAFDESSVPEGAGLVSLDVLAPFVVYLEGVLHPALGLRDAHVQDLYATASRQLAAIETRDRLLAELHEEMGREVGRRDAINAGISQERREAVSERDAIIDRLRAELDRITGGWRRFIVGRPRV